MEKKPNVVPTKEQMNSYAEEKARLEAYERDKPIVMEEIYTNATAPNDTPESHAMFLKKWSRKRKITY